MQINELPSLGRALQSGDQFAVDDANGITYKVDAGNINPTPATISIPTSRWSGSGSDYYITVTASNVTADSILIPQYDAASAALLNGPVWCVPAAGSFTIHTSAKPSGTVTILVLFPGTMGEAHYEVLADVYSKSQVDSIVAQLAKSVKLVSDSVYTDFDALWQNGNGIFSIRTSSTNQSAPVPQSDGYWYVFQATIYANNSYGVQIATRSTNNYNVYMRKRINGTNYSWIKITFENIT